MTLPQLFKPVKKIPKSMAVFFAKSFKSRELKKAEKDLLEINKLMEKIKTLSDEDLKAKTTEFKQRLNNGQNLNDIKLEAFAVAREATYRVLNKYLFDVQILGGLIIHEGSVVEMKTGEGKTITSIPPVYLNALSGKGVWVSTVNEYLTQRDAEETGQVYAFLGLSVGVNLRELDPNQKREAYNQDITYSIHSEIGFDYLRDNMVKKFNEKVQRRFNFCLIDEVDSILIDEARTPLIITGGESSSSEKYHAVDLFVKTLQPLHYDIDWESKSIQLNDQGADKANSFFGTKNIYDIQNSELVHRISNALRANYLMQNDVEYIVHENKILLVDAFTGRIMEGRSYSDGLQQAIQAKEKVEIEPETKTLATITYQNLFRMFKKLSGMTGTSKTEEEEFIDIYNMRVHVIPTNKPMIRIDHPDIVYSDVKYKYQAIVNDIKQRYEKGQPILVGTEEVYESEKLSDMLTKLHIPHKVLNAKQNREEAIIISRAGEVKAITIATNMAGRGTDIKPSPEAIKLGGLYVLGTSKAEARRIDNQLRGRSGRQGDIGESRFYVSLDDKLIKRFSNQKKLKKSFANYKNKPIMGRLINKYLTRAQKKIEGFNFDTRKNLLQYDDVVRQQRDLIYAQRDIIISQDDLINVINRMMRSVIKDLIEYPDFLRLDGTLDLEKFVNSLNQVWFANLSYKLNVNELNGLSKIELTSKIEKELVESYELVREHLISNVDEINAHSIEREIILMTFDQNWQMHIDQMTKLRSSSSLAHYAQKNPYQVYVEKGTELFKDLLQRISHNAVKVLMQNKYAQPQVDEREALIAEVLERRLNENQIKKTKMN